MSSLKSNFAQLKEHDEQLLRLGLLAERYFSEDPNTCLLKIRQFAELLAQHVAANTGSFSAPEESQFDLLRRLQDRGIIIGAVAQLFNDIRKSGNSANHHLQGDHATALTSLKMAWQLGVWFHRTFKDASYKSGPFIPPAKPSNEVDEVKAELQRLSQELQAHQSEKDSVTSELGSLSARLKEASDEKAFWEQYAQEAELAKSELANQLTALQSASESQPKGDIEKRIKSAQVAAGIVVLDEAETRKLIDDQLNQAGWEADSLKLRYSKGARPQKGKNLAIAEWPTESGPADYVLFTGLTPIAVIEAKRKNLDVSSSIQQAKRYSRGFRPSPECSELGSYGKEGEFRIPFVFSTNGRPYLKQIATMSGVWFCDIRRPDYLGHALEGWHSPEGLTSLLKRNESEANDKLSKEPFNYGFNLRDYQKTAIQIAEDNIAAGKREMLLAMATGTGKTKTCIALIYRLLKTQRFGRILFLVDRSALGEQAANAFKDTRMESLQSFADIFGIKELDEQMVDTDTAVHIATIQGMVKRVLYPGVNVKPPTIDQYDCIIVDECHRGYLLDRDLSDTEFSFRSQEDYISKYRRVLEYFDAVKVGLTATPALHTKEIFGDPVYSYSYREAVIDGFLVDHEPPYVIATELSEGGIKWKKGDQVQVYDSKESQLDLFSAPDEIKIDIEDFNKKVITKNFNQVVCEYLATELDPMSRQKTLIFCATDQHADMVVSLLKEAFENQYGSVDDDSVVKITGAADKPLELIRRYKNERQPNVAVTVDLLTTGIDVPEICNIVFLRRVNSRILFDQMLGRATRLCPEVDKEMFKIYDAVRIYEAIQNLTAMKPVVVNPDISFTQLAEEITTVSDEEAKLLIRDQIIAKLQRKRQHLHSKTIHDFETRAGMSIKDFITEMKRLSVQEVADWFLGHQYLGEILDRRQDTQPRQMFVADHSDAMVGVNRGYGNAKKPEDYIESFTEFIQTNRDKIPALVAVLTRPRDLTRRQLRELLIELDKAGYSEANLATAWQQMTNQDIAAKIIGYIRTAAAGDPLVPYDQRVENAYQKMLSVQNWTPPQRQWLQRIASQTKANLLVDRDALDDPDLVFRKEGGGFTRLNKIFNGELDSVLQNFNDLIWQPAA